MSPNNHNSSIETSIELQDEYPSVTERYYTTRYTVTEPENSLNHHCIMFHSNRICLITLADNHPILKEQKVIKNIDYQVSNKVNRLDNKVSGKGKKGGQYLDPLSILCRIECEDGTEYNVYSCIQGKLVEINDGLSLDSSLLLSKAKSDGHIAIVLPKLSVIEQYKESFLTYDQYIESCKN